MVVGVLFLSAVPLLLLGMLLLLMLFVIVIEDGIGGFVYVVVCFVR